VRLYAVKKSPAVTSTTRVAVAPVQVVALDEQRRQRKLPALQVSPQMEN
jgi:hypothetical protein